MRDRILIGKGMIPYSFDIVLGNEEYELLIKYNTTIDLFTINLLKDSTLIAVEPIIYNHILFSDMYMVGKYPIISIVPTDESNEENSVNWENFGETVFLTIDDEE